MADQPSGWLRRGVSDPTEVAQVYDGWATSYDDDLADWGYEAPAFTVERLAATQPDASPVLDVGCGTGLVGARLRAAGFDDLVGIDLSASLLDQARAKGIYRELHQVDLQQDPVPTADDHFGALLCVGVMTYLPDTVAVVTEFARVVQPGGSILFTQREDLWVERAGAEVLDQLSADGVCTVDQVSEPLPYLPGNDELSTTPARLIHLRSA